MSKNGIPVDRKSDLKKPAEVFETQVPAPSGESRFSYIYVCLPVRIHMYTCTCICVYTYTRVSTGGYSFSFPLRRISIRLLAVFPLPEYDGKQVKVERRNYTGLGRECVLRVRFT